MARSRPPPRPASLQDPPTGKLTRASRFLAGLRWLYMPIGLLALIAVGVHAAADALDDRVLWVVDHADAAFDGLVGRWKLTAPLVDLVDLDLRVTIARSVALVWELAVDLVLALPALGYHERDPAQRAPRPLELALHPERTAPWRALFERVRTHPTTLRIIRPLASGAVVVAGACAVARMVQGALYLSSRGVLGDGFAGLLARLAAIAALAAVAYSLGWRAVLRNLQHADEVSREGRMTRRRAVLQGWVGSVLVLPIAFAALVDAAPLTSFFR